MHLKRWPKDSVAILVCRIGDPYYKHVPDSEEIECWNCGHKCMISPATLARSYKINSTIICVNCANAYCEASGQKLLRIPDDKEQQKERASSLK